MRNATSLLLIPALALGLSACSEKTQDHARETANSAAVDADRAADDAGAAADRAAAHASNFAERAGDRIDSAVERAGDDLRDGSAAARNDAGHALEHTGRKLRE